MTSYHVIARTCSVLFLGLLIAAIGAGCQNSSKPSGELLVPTQRALVISGGQSGSTVVYIPTVDNSGVQMLSTSGTAVVCAQCRADAIKYFQTGVLVPKCPVCGALRTPVNYVPPTVSGIN
jgi:hypothetical protein